MFQRPLLQLTGAEKSDAISSDVVMMCLVDHGNDFHYRIVPLAK